MGTTARDLFIAFDRSRRRSLRVQVEDGLREAIRSGRLRAGAAVPSTRALAADLEVTRKVIVEAYEQLVAEGYLVSRRGAGTVVNQAPQRRPRTRPSPTGPATVVVDFRPGRPDLDLFPRAAWARASRLALRTLPTRDLAYDDPRGLPVLRGAIADYLARARGTRTDPESVIVCAGFSHGFDLVLSVLAARGHDWMAVEDPGYAAPRRQLAARGLRYDGVAVDGDGLRVDALRRTAARVVHVTPAHQSPTGVVLSAERRQQLIAWAREVDGYVIEDDYDAEYRYDRRPVGTLQGVAPDRVIYCGTTSKTLASGVRLGWLAVPPGLVDPIVAWRHLTDGSTSTILQATFAAFLVRRRSRSAPPAHAADLPGSPRRGDHGAPAVAAPGHTQRSVRRTERAGDPAGRRRRAGRGTAGAGERGTGVSTGRLPATTNPQRHSRHGPRLRLGPGRQG